MTEPDRFERMIATLAAVYSRAPSVPIVLKLLAARESRMSEESKPTEAPPACGTSSPTRRRKPRGVAKEHVDHYLKLEEQAVQRKKYIAVYRSVLRSIREEMAALRRTSDPPPPYISAATPSKVGQ